VENLCSSTISLRGAIQRIRVAYKCSNSAFNVLFFWSGAKMSTGCHINRSGEVSQFFYLLILPYCCIFLLVISQGIACSAHFSCAGFASPKFSFHVEQNAHMAQNAALI
jgi:hypothetical protein